LGLDDSSLTESSRRNLMIFGARKSGATLLASSSGQLGKVGWFRAKPSDHGRADHAVKGRLTLEALACSGLRRCADRLGLCAAPLDLG
jgi:hypothetical protein